MSVRNCYTRQIFLFYFIKVYLTLGLILVKDNTIIPILDISEVSLLKCLDNGDHSTTFIKLCGFNGEEHVLIKINHSFEIKPSLHKSHFSFMNF